MFPTNKELSKGEERSKRIRIHDFRQTQICKKQLRGAPAPSPSWELPNPSRKSSRALTSACTCSQWNTSTLWGKDGISQGENRDFTCQSKKSLRRTSPEVLISRSGSGELLVYKHLSSSDSDTSLKDRHSLLDPFSDLVDIPQTRIKGFYANSGLQIKTGWWSWTTESSTCFWQTLLSAPQAIPTAISAPRASHSMLFET